LSGTYANVKNNNPYIYPQDDTTSAWVMLFNNSSNGYAQVGWIKHSDGSRYNFSEVNTAETGWNFSRKEYGSSSVGSSPQYKMTVSNDWFHFFIGGVDYRDFNSTTYTGCDAEQSGEIHNLASQMPGESSNPDLFTNPYVLDSSWHLTRYWITFTGDKYGHPVGAFANATYGSPFNELDIWDTCS
jgi:hypothetical protein